MQQRVGKLVDHLQAASFQLIAASVAEFMKTPWGQVLHDNVVLPVFFADFVGVDNVRMIQVQQKLTFPSDALQVFVSGPHISIHFVPAVVSIRMLFGDELDGHLKVARRILTLVDRGHAAHGHRLGDLKATDILRYLLILESGDRGSLLDQLSPPSVRSSLASS
ncbi:MAG: hypothetical protein O2857_06820 [Planctomycetota bacterium]|nr:hypothetical protein [Planctomycetota bacterium]